MVFSSIPVYQLDHPNWQEHQPGGVGDNSQLPPPMPPQPTSGSIRPNSTAERAQLTKLVQPETAQKCPRCGSTDTKFCYYNNYSLSQPRHFCKTCRRYWTRGGALRNVPVGRGCQRIKKSKTSARSKSTPVITGGSSSTSGISSSSSTSDIIGHLPLPPLPQFPFLPPVHDHISNFGTGDHIGFSSGGVQPPVTLAAGGGTGGFGDDQQQFPFLSGLEPPSAAGMYQFQSEVCDFSGQIAVLKFEENQELNLPKKFLGFSGNDQQCWSIGNALIDINGFTSSASNLL